MHRPVVRFVRDVLGCRCPDEVLRSITVDRSRLIGGSHVEVTRLDAGGRLLVYVVPVAAVQSLGAVVADALAAGLAERESRGCNRFRLVLACADPAALAAPARAAFDACPRPDDRVHLHLVPLAELRALS